MRVPMIGLRTDQAPTSDINVRRALFMATNFEAIRDGFYDGTGSVIWYPIPNIQEWSYAYTPLEELSPIIQEMYTYNPEKAKQLLTDAGYPDGFKLTVPTAAVNVDLLSILKADWAKVDVELDIAVKEAGAVSGILDANLYDVAMSGTGVGVDLDRIDPDNYRQNTSRHNDQKFIEFKREWQDALFNIKDTDKRRAVVKDVSERAVNYMTEQAFTMPMPGGSVYHFWQPYLKGYSGESYVGYWVPWQYPRFVWIDQDLKKEITGR